MLHHNGSVVFQLYTSLGSNLLNYLRLTLFIRCLWIVIVDLPLPVCQL